MTSEREETTAAPSKDTGIPIMSCLYHVCRILLGLIFVIASLDKLARPWDFGRAIYVYHLLEGVLGYLISPVAIIMPAVELVTGILLIINRLVRPAALLVFAMNVIFIIAILSAILRGLDIDCGCGLDVGIFALLAGTQAGTGALVRDLIFVAMNLVVLFSPLSISKKPARRQLILPL